MKPRKTYWDGPNGQTIAIEYNVVEARGFPEDELPDDAYVRTSRSGNYRVVGPIWALKRIGPGWRKRR